MCGYHGDRLGAEQGVAGEAAGTVLADAARVL